MRDPVLTPTFELAKRHFLEGLDHFQAGDYGKAELLFQASLQLLPQRISTLVNLAATQLKLDRPQAALNTAVQVLSLEADNADALFHEATARAHLQQHALALQGLERLLRLNDQWAQAWVLHGEVLQAVGQQEQAVHSYQRAVSLEPGLTLAWVNLGHLLREANRPSEAAQAYRQAIHYGANPELLRFYLAAVSNEPAPTSAPPAHVQALFDDYAAEFDEHLVKVLGYQAHHVLVRHLQALGAGPFICALDLGCGTGLSGPLLKPLCQRLHGVDLSPAMLDKARALGVYDELVQADIVQHLRSSAERYDLVAATDVFIYVGELTPTFTELQRLMPAGGIFCFSAEEARPGCTGFELLPSLRYAHSETYLRQLAQHSGFDCLAVRREPVRADQKQAVDGLFVYLRRHN